MYHADSSKYLNLISGIPETMWSYFAAIVDGEASFCIYRNSSKSKCKYTCGWRRDYILQIGSASPPFLHEIQRRLKLGKINEYKYLRKPEDKNYKSEHDSYDYVCFLRFEANEIRAILPRIIPYLILKKEMAEIMDRSLKVGETVKRSDGRREKLIALDAEFHEAYIRTKNGIPHRTSSDFWDRKRKEAGRSPIIRLGDN